MPEQGVVQPLQGCHWPKTSQSFGSIPLLLSRGSGLRVTARATTMGLGAKLEFRGSFLTVTAKVTTMGLGTYLECRV